MAEQTEEQQVQQLLKSIKDSFDVKALSKEKDEKDALSDVYAKVRYYFEKYDLDPVPDSVKDNKEDIESFVKKYSLKDLEEGRDVMKEKDEENKQHYFRVVMALVMAMIVFYVVKQL